jgi:hypothetical protein
MFFGMDMDDGKRSHTPMFYGVVPDSTMRKLLVRAKKGYSSLQST